LALTNQIHIYSLDTSAFFYKKERLLYNKIGQLNSEIIKLQEELKDINKKLLRIGDIKTLENKYIFAIANDLIARKLEIENNYIRHKKNKINKIKHKLIKMLQNNCKNNELYFKKYKCNYRTRVLNKSYLITKNIISVFESSLTRTLNIRTNQLSEDIMVIKVYYFDVLRDLILHGYMHNNEKYRFFTASAGQIRTKKTVFIKESLWDKYQKIFMCGLTIDLINKKGGINKNKYLAYLALINSATDLWIDFDIDKCIVVDDFETNVTGVVDFIDDETYKIHRKEMPVPINHTDGCGMILPKLSKKNFMIRLPWIKGLLASFDYVKFIKEHNCSSIVKDIYGKEWDIIKDDIQIIFTKSQFKMYKYYKDWDEYKRYFKKYKCQAGICNYEEDYIKNARINYQMLQTLSEMTDDELRKLCEKSNERLDKLSSNLETMLEVFGVTKYNKNKTYLQQALEIYPELLSDVYTKDVLKAIKKRLIKEYRAGKLEIMGKFTFIVPDLYAFCEYLFCDNKNPKGLLKNGEVYCRLYKNVDKLDCLRSPHLYREHAVRNNVIDDIKSEWFTTDAVYTSCHDLISKILQFDVDGDRSLVVADPLLVSVAERHMNDIVPLYYNMKKAEPDILTNQTIYNGLIAAYIGGNIGAKSNDITKIWNSGKMTDDKLMAIKLLCMENNFTIDYAKTLYKPERPKNIKTIITKYTNAKVPYFFIYAKDYERNKVEKINDSLVNRIGKIVINKKMNFSNNKFGKFDYEMLLSKKSNNVLIDKNLINVYIKLNQNYRYKINMEDERKNNISYIAKEIRMELGSFGYDDMTVTDMLIKYLYGIKNSKHKESLWFCYGDVIVENLKKNIGDKMDVCLRCGKRYKKKVAVQKYCEECSGYKTKDKKTIKCIDCGESIIVSSKNTKTCRCKKCAKIHRNNYQKELMRKRRQKNC